jgi:integrase
MQDLPESPTPSSSREPWNKGKLIGAKAPLRAKHVWAIRSKLQVEGKTRDLAMTTRQYARLVAAWTASIGLDAKFFGTHSLRRTKATLIYRRTGNLRAVQLLLGHKKIESTVRYLGIEVDDALAIAEQVDV